MATTNQNYADLFTLRFYSSLLAPPTVKPSELPNISTIPKVEVKKNRPEGNVGYCLQTKLSIIEMRIHFTEDSLGDQSSSLQEYKRCLNASVQSTLTEEETSECLSVSNHNNAISLYGLEDNSPYRAFTLESSVEDDVLVLKGQSFLINDSGVADYSLLKDKLCSSTKTRTYNQTHKVCQNRIGALATTPGPQYPIVSPQIPEFQYKGYRTSWIFREAILGFVNSGGFQFETNCACEETNPTKPSTVAALVEPTSSGISGRTTTTVARRGTSSRTVTTRSTSGGGGGSSY